MFEKILVWYKENLQERVREGLRIAAKAFFDTLWNYIKEDVILAARKSLKKIEEIASSADGAEVKKKILDLIMSKIKLPIVLRPFKGLIRNLISKKIDEILHNIFGKGFELLG